MDGDGRTDGRTTVFELHSFTRLSVFVVVVDVIGDRS